MPRQPQTDTQEEMICRGRNHKCRWLSRSLNMIFLICEIFWIFFRFLIFQVYLHFTLIDTSTVNNEAYGSISLISYAINTQCM